MIRTVKKVVFAIIKNTTLTGLQMLTLFSEILVNDHLSTHLSKEYEDLESLTLSGQVSQNGQTHSNNSLAIC